MQMDRIEIPHGFCHCGCGEKTTLAPQTRIATGMVRGEPLRYIKNHAQRVRQYPQRRLHLPPIDDWEVMWIAGLLEGEGCFDNTTDGRLRIRLKMTDRDIVERFSEMVGSSTVHEYTPHMRNAGWKPQYTTSIYGTRAWELVYLIRPVLGARRQGKIDALSQGRK